MDVMITLNVVDYIVIILYGLILVWMGFYFKKRSDTSEGFMVASRGIPAWAAGLAIMSAYTSSISYVATPGKAFSSDWHPMIFALVILPLTWWVTKYVIPDYRKINLISVYQFLEERLGGWARAYAALAFVFFMVGRVAVILYLIALVLQPFVPVSLLLVILILGALTILYTMMGGMEAVVWTDVLQSATMLAGITFVVLFLTTNIFGGSEPLIQNALAANKFSLGSTSFSFTKRTIWVMIIYGISENLRNLMADQNYVQKYSSTSSISQARRSVWIAMLIYIPLTAIFLYVGTALFAFYSEGGLPVSITSGDQVFPYFIATKVPLGLRGLIIAAIVAAAMSTVDSALNCSATVSLLDFFKPYFAPDLSDRKSVIFLRSATVFWGILGTGFGLFMIGAKSTLDIWWTIAGIFGSGILGIFLVAYLRPRVQRWQGILGIIIAILFNAWGIFARDLPAGWEWFECNLDSIVVGATGAGLMVVIILALSYLIPTKKVKESGRTPKDEAK